MSRIRRAMAAGRAAAQRAGARVRRWVGRETEEGGRELAQALRQRDSQPPHEPPVPLVQATQPLDPVDTAKGLIRQLTAAQRAELQAFLTELGRDKPGG